MTKKFDKLQKQEDKIYNQLIDLIHPKLRRKFCKLLNDYVDIQIELERECNI